MEKFCRPGPQRTNRGGLGSPKPPPFRHLRTLAVRSGQPALPPICLGNAPWPVPARSPNPVGAPYPVVARTRSSPPGAVHAVQDLKSLWGNRICSGRGCGAGCQSRAQSTICRIRWNHHCGLWIDGRRLTDDDRRARRLPKPSSSCALFIVNV